MPTVIPKHLRNAANSLADGPYCELFEPSREDRAAFLQRVAEGASFRQAATEVGLPYLAFGRLMVTDENFNLELEAAKILRAQALEEILLEQCTVGIQVPLTHQGKVTGHQIQSLVTNNPSLLALLKANNPEKFRERSEVVHRESDEPVPDRITTGSDRDRLLAALRQRAENRQPAEDPEDLL